MCSPNVHVCPEGHVVKINNLNGIFDCSRMIYLYGDSHTNAFNNLQISYVNRHQSSITMFRIGRDNQIINFNTDTNSANSVVCITYGEIDCRCHIQRQINQGRVKEDICQELVTKYMNTIKTTITNYKAIIVVAIIPTTNQQVFERIHGPITHEFPFVGTNEERVEYTAYMNTLLEKSCLEHGYIFFNPYAYYTDEQGYLRFDLSDTIVHIKDTDHFISEFMTIYNSLHS